MWVFTVCWCGGLRYIKPFSQIAVLVTQIWLLSHLFLITRFTPYMYVQTMYIFAIVTCLELKSPFLFYLSPNVCDLCFRGSKSKFETSGTGDVETNPDHRRGVNLTLENKFSALQDWTFSITDLPWDLSCVLQQEMFSDMKHGSSIPSLMASVFFVSYSMEAF